MQNTTQKEVTCLTALPVELLRTVADYLTVDEFYTAFSGITDLLTMLSEQMWLAYTRLPPYPSQAVWRRLVAGSDRIHALVLLESAVSIAFLGQPTWPLLRSVTFVSVNPQEIDLVLRSYLPMEQLESVTIETRHSDNVRPEDLALFLNPDDMPALYRLTLLPHPESPHYKPINLHCLSSELITHFTLTHSLKLEDSPLLLTEYFPRLIYLNIHIVGKNHSLFSADFRHERLQSLVIHLDDYCFASDELNRSVFALNTLNMTPSLERYSVHCRSRILPDVGRCLSPHLTIPKNVQNVRLYFERYSLPNNVERNDQMNLNETVTKLRSAMHEHYECLNPNFTFLFRYIETNQ
jgi:hypothetical protein